MLREWTLGNFKSVGSERSVPLRNLTVLAGANSSGKSTLIQSILLISQTLSSKLRQRHLVLNGELAKLGSFTDVVNHHARPKSITLGFSLEIKSDGSQANRYVPRNPHSRQIATSALPSAGVADSARGTTIRFRATFGPKGLAEDGPSDKPARLQADLHDARLASEAHSPRLSPRPGVQRDTPSTIAYHRDTDRSGPRLAHASDPGSYGARGPGSSSLEYHVELSGPIDAQAPFAHRLLALSTRQPARDKPPKVALQQFLPSSLVFHRNVATREFERRLFDLVQQHSRLDAMVRLWKESDSVSYRAFAAALEATARKHRTSIQDLFKRLHVTSLFPDTPASEDDWTAYAFTSYVQSLGSEDRDRTVPVKERLPHAIAEATESIRDFFGSIRYLGPLRDDPRPVYAIAGNLDPRDVGAKGQFTAAVLDLHASTIIDAPSPEGRTSSPQPLEQIVAQWMRYFGLAEHITTREEGQLGHRIGLTPRDTKHEVDLTNVGVGVSQLLPVVVMCLLAEPGALLLFEQPELHLHPAVQSLLGDFFLAIAESGRQCVVETHSEYLINRLRLRIAESPPESKLQDLVLIHFVERSDTGTIFRPIEINPYGGIPDWPAGFFDQGPDEAERILNAARRKRRDTERKRGDGHA